MGETLGLKCISKMIWRVDQIILHADSDGTVFGLTINLLCIFRI